MIHNCSIIDRCLLNFYMVILTGVHTKKFMRIYIMYNNIGVYNVARLIHYPSLSINKLADVPTY